MYYATYEDCNVHGFTSAAERDGWIATAPERHMRPCKAITSKEAREIATSGWYVSLHGEESLAKAPKWLLGHIDRNCRRHMPGGCFEGMWDEDEGAYIFPSDWGWS